MQTTWENSVQHIEIALGQDISTELQTRELMAIPQPSHSQGILDRHMRKVHLRNATHNRFREARNNVL